MTPAHVLEEGFAGGRPRDERIQVILRAEVIIFVKVRFWHDIGSSGNVARQVNFQLPTGMKLMGMLRIGRSIGIWP